MKISESDYQKLQQKRVRGKTPARLAPLPRAALRAGCNVALSPLCRLTKLQWLLEHAPDGELHWVGRLR